MSSESLSVLLLSSLSLLTTWGGVLLAVRLRDDARAIAAGIGFSVGIMLLVSLLELVPETVDIVGPAAMLASFALGAGLVWSGHVLIPHTHLFEERGRIDGRLLRSASLVAFGLILHDVPEGFAMANAYIASPDLGVMVAIAIALHNVPEEFAMAVPAVMLRSRGFLLGAAALSALAEPLGAVVGLAAVSVAPGLNAHFMGFAAGAMTFVSIHELLPMARRYGHLAWLAPGVLLSGGVYAGLTVIGA